jgi:alanyl-tRNA synthetase
VTLRLYYTDPTCRRFEGTVVDARQHEGRPAVVLDRTAFYPTSGGQPFDTGRLNDVDVLDVVDDGDAILHVVSSVLPVGERVEGVVDAARRLDHTQQHTGQHLLSAAFDRIFDNRTVGFHMGADVSTIDLAKSATWEDIARAEREANDVVWQNRPVWVRFVTAVEASALPLRKESAREGTLRLIEVPGFDLSACGGTHVTRAGEVGVIAVTGAERFKGGSRITFVCGQRALGAFGAFRDAVTGSVRALSVLPAELPDAIERLQADARRLRQSMRGLQEQLAGHEARRIVSEAAAAGHAGRIVHRLDGWDAAGVKAVALAITGLAPATAVLVGRADPTTVAVATSIAGHDARSVWASIQAACGGKGGGTASLVQGAVPADADRICAEAQRLLDGLPE